jgi:hypothetical protein
VSWKRLPFVALICLTADLHTDSKVCRSNVIDLIVYSQLFILPAFSAQTVDADSDDHHFSFDNKMNRLKAISRSLRGPNKNPPSIVMQLKSMAVSFSATLGSIQDQCLCGEKEKAGATLKAAVGGGWYQIHCRHKQGD